MRLRNWKETVPPTIEDTLRDVNPPSLEAGFHWYADINQPVWVHTKDENGQNYKWRRGRVVSEGKMHLTPRGVFRSFYVEYQIKRKSVVECFTPGFEPGEMKPDTPHVRELLREAGYFI